MTLSYQEILERLESIEADVQERQAVGETSALEFFKAKRDYELAYALKFMDTTGSVTERKLKAQAALEKDPAYLKLLQHEGAYEGWKAVMRALEQRASIGQSLLRAQRETGG